MAISRSLGRGLGSLIPKRNEGKSTAAERLPSGDAASGKVVPAGSVPLLIPVERILPNPRQPRERFSHRELDELVSSIKSHGILQPLLVTQKSDGTFELIAGERRLRAARLVGLSSVPVIVRGAEGREKLELALIENLQREDLNPIEEARAYRTLMDEYGLTQDEVAGRVGKSRPRIANTVRLLELPDEIRDAVSSGALPPSAARALLSAGDRDEQIAWWQKMQQEKLSVHEIEEAIGRTRQPRRSVALDVNIEADQTAIRNAMGTKVAVKKRGETGKIELSFFSNEEYRVLVNRLTRRG